MTSYFERDRREITPLKPGGYRTIPYGRVGGPFFNPDILARIEHGRSKSIDLVGFMSAYGLHVIPEKTDSLFQLLCNEKYKLRDVLERTPEGSISFPSGTISKVAHAIELASVEQQMIEAVAGGIDELNEIGRILAENVVKQH
ncbi:MAG: hypothetical protein M1277_01405 [Patescibacteria group bacterium]|nr:hypothetical protein [Patescibacteria group bacterium]